MGFASDLLYAPYLDALISIAPNTGLNDLLDSCADVRKSRRESRVGLNQMSCIALDFFEVRLSEQPVYGIALIS